MHGTRLNCTASIFFSYLFSLFSPPLSSSLPPSFLPSPFSSISPPLPFTLPSPSSPPPFYTLSSIPGVLGSPRTCLHSVLSLVNHGPDPNNPIGCHFRNPKLAELCYKLLCQMCANRDLSTPTLRYLRNNHDFFFVQLTQLPLKVRSLHHVDGEEPEIEDINSLQVALLHQQAWLLKSIAIELRMTSLSHQRSHAQRITNILLSEQASLATDQGQLASGITTELQVRPDSDFFQEGHRKILVLLDLVDFSDKPLPLLEIQCFNQSAMEQAIGLCETQVSRKQLSSSFLHYSPVISQ